jgi:hypothetical protein
MFGQDPRQTDADEVDETTETTETTDGTDETDTYTDEQGDVEGDAEVPFEPSFDERAEPEAPATGDPSIDDAMTDLAVAQSGSFEERIEAGERAHRLLQGRLGGLGEA